jgi:predicted RNA-binding Zn-ribbon protein involved in translation (DUF1610 family)
MKKEFFCLECDCHFTVTMQKGYTVEYCPACGSEICSDDCNDYEDDQE